MKIIVVHGDNTQKVIDRLDAFITTAKKRDWKIERIDSESPLNLSESITAGHLFEKEKLFLVKEPANVPKEDLTWLKVNHKNVKGTVVFYSDGVITKTTLSRLPRPDKVEEYKLPVVIFKFLESFYPGNSDEAMRLLHRVVKTEAAEFVLALLARHLKDLFLLKIDVALAYPSWRLGKLKTQAQKFSKGQIKSIFAELALADMDSKTSKRDLLFSLDLIIATRLE